MLMYCKPQGQANSLNTLCKNFTTSSLALDTFLASCSLSPSSWSLKLLWKGAHRKTLCTVAAWFLKCIRPFTFWSQAGWTQVNSLSGLRWCKCTFSTCFLRASRREKEKVLVAWHKVVSPRQNKYWMSRHIIGYLQNASLPSSASLERLSDGVEDLWVTSHRLQRRVRFCKAWNLCCSVNYSSSRGSELWQSRSAKHYLSSRMYVGWGSRYSDTAPERCQSISKVSMVLKYSVRNSASRRRLWQAFSLAIWAMSFWWYA